MVSISSGIPPSSCPPSSAPPPPAASALLRFPLLGSGAESPYEKCANVLGKGAYGTVYKGRDRNNPDRVVALKEIRIPMTSDEGMPMNALREIGLLKQLDRYNHPNVVRLLDVVPGARTHREMKLMLVFEHIDQDLAQFLERCPTPGLGPDMIKDIFHQILSGVDFIHTHRILHRDLKPQNILVSGSGQQVKLADFGLARSYGHLMVLTSVVVTLYYRAPEVLLQDEYSLPIDLWSCGCIFAELHTRRPLFRGTSEQEQLCKIFECIGSPSEDEWPDRLSLPLSSFRPSPRQRIETFVPDLDQDSIDLIERLLTFNQRARVTASDALRHPYFRDVRHPLPHPPSRTLPQAYHSLPSDLSSSDASDESLMSGGVLEDDLGVRPLADEGAGNGMGDGDEMGDGVMGDGDGVRLGDGDVLGKGVVPGDAVKRKGVQRLDSGEVVLAEDLGAEEVCGACDEL